MVEYYCVIERSDGFSEPTYWGGGDVNDFGKLNGALKLVDKGDALKVLYNLKPWPTGCRVAEVDHRPQAAPPRVPPSADQVRAYNFAELETLVSRFLGWTVPQTACADACASDPKYAEKWPNLPRSGTNFFSAIEAKEMLIHVLQLEPKP